MTSRRFATLLFCVLLVSCVETTSPSSTTTTATTQPTTTTTSPGEGLTVWVDDPRYDLIAGAAASFSEASGIAVDVSRVSFEDTLAAVKAGEGPDVFLASHEHLGEFLRDGLVQPVELDRLDLDPVAVAAVSDGDVTYGVPYGMEAVALFTRAEGDASFAGIAAAGGTVGLPDHWFYAYGFLSASGGYLFGSSIDDVGVSKGATGLAALQQLIAKGTVAVAPYADLVDEFTAGDIDALVTGPWQVAQFVDRDTAFSVVPLPTLDGMTLRPLVGVQAFFVAADANRDLAASFVREVLQSPDVLAGAAAADDRVPAYLPGRGDYLYPGFVAGVDGGDLIPSFPNAVLAWDPLSGLFDDVFAGLPPPLADTEATIRNMISP
jgi:arabinogalactan oligomer/maltooligosaccharide transport system substrate-binding protein